ncbi:hypothetical protein HZS_3865 [Henneguya salminicola]|nr:hypothetical protein HZS_3865 [Henneguya salminicola]
MEYSWMTRIIITEFEFSLLQPHWNIGHTWLFRSDPRKLNFSEIINNGNEARISDNFNAIFGD